MGKLPLPPATLPALRAGHLFNLTPALVLWRVYFAGDRYPSQWDALRHWGPTNARFDHHPSPAAVHPRLGIIYAGSSPVVALAEAFQDTRVINRRRGDPYLCAFTVVGDHSLLDLRGAWPTLAGASQAIASGSRSRARSWSRAIHGSYPVEGLIYRSSMFGPGGALALYERVQGAAGPWATLLLNKPLSDINLQPALAGCAAQIGYSIL